MPHPQQEHQMKQEDSVNRNGAGDELFRPKRKPARTTPRICRRKPEGKLPKLMTSAEPTAGTGGNGVAPVIEPEPVDAIHVGGGGKLSVPREDPDDGLDIGAEIDLVGTQPKKIRKPARHEWVALSPASELTTRLLPVKPSPDAFEAEYYFVGEKLRGPIIDELKLVRVFVFYSLASMCHGLWVVRVSPGNGYYESLHSLFHHPPRILRPHGRPHCVLPRPLALPHLLQAAGGRGDVADEGHWRAARRGTRAGALHHVAGPPGLPRPDRRRGVGPMTVAASEIWSVDAEWGFRDGRIDQESAWEPVVLCLVGLRSGRGHHFWARDTGLHAFLREHADDVFLAHYDVAEMKYLLRQQVPLPTRWYDTFAGWRSRTNRPDHLEAGLAQALVELGLPGLAPAQKKALQQKILHLRFDANSPTDRREITDYCFSDCDGCAALYSRLAGGVAPALMAHWVEYMKAVARMELRGVPFDTEEHLRIQDMRPAIKANLIGNVNATWPVFDGESFRKQSFLRWCRKAGIDWPVRLSDTTGLPYHCVDQDTMKEMECRDKFIGEVRQVIKTIAQFKRHSLAVDPILKRHFFHTSVLRSVTGRNQPRNFIFTAPKWMRYLIVPESPEHVLVYVDYVAQEIGIAAALSGDPMLRSVYEADDCHIAFAIRAGAAPVGATKQTHGDVRKRYKTVNLGVQYGQTAYGIANRLGILRAEAETLVDRHKAMFPTFWRWSERTVQGAYDRGWIATPCGWRSRVPFRSNPRTWMNWPVQAAGGDIMRLTVTYLDRQNVRVLAPVHDGSLLSCPRSQLDDLRAAVEYACTTAVEHVLPGFRLRWDFTVHDQGRFQDEDGRALWSRLQSIMEPDDAETYPA
jgi:hypothetical protein